MVGDVQGMDACMHVQCGRKHGLTRSEGQGGHAASHKFTGALGCMCGPGSRATLEQRTFLQEE